MQELALDEWTDGAQPDTGSSSALFNCDALAHANRLEGNLPLRLRCGQNVYLAYRRNASLVVPAISTADMHRMLTAGDALRPVVAPFGVRALAMNSFNAPSAATEDLKAIVTGPGKLRYEFVLDIAAYSEKKISSNHRRNIKKAAKANMVFRWMTGGQSVKAHLGLVNENLEGKGVGGLGNSVDYFCCLLEEGVALLGQVFDGDELVASTFFVVNSQGAYYHSSGTNPHGRKYGAAHYLVDQALQDMRERGMSQFNLGGATSSQGGLLRFKTGFRPETRLLVAASCTLGGGMVTRLRQLLRPAREPAVELQALVAHAVPGAVEDFSLMPADEQALLSDVIEYPELGPCLTALWQHGGSYYRLSGSRGVAAALVLAAGAESGAVDGGAPVAVLAAGFTAGTAQDQAGPALLPALAGTFMGSAGVDFSAQVQADDDRLLAQMGALGFK